MRLAFELVAGALAAGAVGTDLFLETRRKEAALMAGVVLASAFLEGGLAAAGLAGGILLRRFHPLLVPVPGILSFLLGNPLPLGAAGAWALASPRMPWVGLVVVAALLIPAPVVAGAALLAGSAGWLLTHHPANASLARTMGRAAPWMLPIPLVGLFLLAILKRAATGDWVILRWAFLGVLLGIVLLIALLGLALRFVAVSGFAGSTIAAVACATMLLVYAGATGGFALVEPGVGMLLVPLVLAGGPAVPRLPPAVLALAVLVPLLAAI